jgi:hypothetical protein
MRSSSDCVISGTYIKYRIRERNPKDRSRNEKGGGRGRTGSFLDPFSANAPNIIQQMMNLAHKVRSPQKVMQK